MAQDTMTKQNPAYSRAEAIAQTGTATALERQQQKRAEKKKKRKKWLLLLLLLLMLLGGIFIWYRFFGPGVPIPAKDQPQDITKMVVGGDVQDGVFTQGMTADEIEAAMQAVADKDNFNLQIAPEMHFKTGDSLGLIEIVNPKSNVYPISVEITLQKEGTVVYQSGLIKPEQYIAEGKLLVNLPAGTHAATGTVTIYSEDGTKVNATTVVDMKIIVDE